MDETTAAVRAMYEQYPYPASAVVNRVGSDAELVLSYASKRPKTTGPYQVLDAGCDGDIGKLFLPDQLLFVIREDEQGLVDAH